MTPSNSSPGPPPTKVRAEVNGFRTTQWDLVLDAAATGPEQVPALEGLCRSYWRPLYVYARGRGYSACDAEDLTQAFFERLLQKQWLRNVRPGLGSFRAFLLVAMRRFIINDRRWNHAEKRGGAHGTEPLEDAREECIEQRCNGSRASESPEEAFDRNWALEVLDQAFHRLRHEMKSAGRERLFDALSPYLSHIAETGEYEATARQFHLSQSGINAAVYRLRRRYRETMRQVVAETVSEPGQIDEEMSHLLDALRRR